MSSTRGRVGRVGRVGGMVTDIQGASGRTDASQQTRPAFKLQAQWQRPISNTAVGGGGMSPFLDLNSVSFWRFFWTGLAVAYILGFHLRLGRVRLGVGPG